ncbi:MAG: hypothetical protein HND47_18145 [Chloroflexi bacterium]|nr:hypothetical protein [Chloroflexota bacterium]
MKKLLSLFFAISLTLSACGTAVTQSAPPAQTGMPTLTPTATQTPTATTPALAPGASVTPLPTIPTFTPTFDVSTIVTVTPAEKACRSVDQTLEIDLGYKKMEACINSARANNQDTFTCLNQNLYNEILNYLNLGGDINKIVLQLEEEFKGYDRNKYFNYIDLTGDSLLDLLLRDTMGFYTGGFYIYNCTNGEYKINFDAHQDTGMEVYSIQDINLNGLPEIVFLIENTVLIIFEWDGSLFAEKLGIRDYGESQYTINDTNNDGLKEIILSRGYPPFFGSDEVPWRHYTSIYVWNGSSYTLEAKEFEYPTYRFQAIQDADNYVRAGLYGNAFSYYQAAISDNKLDWWTPERHEFLISTWLIPNPPTPPSSLQPDLSEYPRLAAYAYYRIMLLHLVQGQDAEAASTYQTLQDTFGSNPYAAPYVEMATAFWEAYQSTKRVYDGCAAAIQYAAEHPEILIPLGSDYHGAQSHIYEPADVCPFR